MNRILNLILICAVTLGLLIVVGGLVKRELDRREFRQSVLSHVRADSHNLLRGWRFYFEELAETDPCAAQEVLLSGTGPINLAVFITNNVGMELEEIESISKPIASIPDGHEVWLGVSDVDPSDSSSNSLKSVKLRLYVQGDLVDSGILDSIDDEFTLTIGCSE